MRYAANRSKQPNRFFKPIELYCGLTDSYKVLTVQQDFSMREYSVCNGKFIFYHLLDFRQQLFIKKFPHIFTVFAGVA